MPLDTVIVADSPHVSAAFGLAGSLIGEFSAGTVGLVVARQARAAAEQSWIRDSRRDSSDRFLTSAQRLATIDAMRVEPGLTGGAGRRATSPRSAEPTSRMRTRRGRRSGGTVSRGER